MSTFKTLLLLIGLGLCTMFLSGCTDIGTPTGGGAGSGKICVKVSTDEKGPITVTIQAVGFGGPNALTKFTGTTTQNGPFKDLEVCTNQLPGDPESQKWEVSVTVSSAGKQIDRKSFSPQTYKY